MTALPDFRLETHFAKWEFAARHHLTASDAESLRLDELLAMATEEEREAFRTLWLGYTEPPGAPDLRASIAATYEGLEADDIRCFAGAEEAIFAAMSVLLDRDSHAIVVTPNYQAAETIPLGICAASGVPLDPDDGWSLDVDRVAAAIRPETRLVSINFPHNPTGAVLSDDRFEALVALCRKHGLYLFSDEVFHGLGRTGARHLPPAAAAYERALSLGVMSKTYGLPGLRIGWLASRDREALGRIERMKHYLSICNAGPSERLALIALANRARIVGRNCALVDRNLETLDAFFARWPGLFDWTPSQGGCIAYPRYLGAEGVEAFARRLLEESGVLVLPASLFRSELTETPDDRFRIGFGRSGLETGLEALEGHLARLAA